MKLPNIFYQYYEAISGWTLQARIVLNMTVLVLLLFILLKLTYRFWKFLWLKLRLGFGRVFYLAGSDIYYESRLRSCGKEKHARLREKQNKFSRHMEEMDARLRKMLKDVKERRKKFGFRWGILLYAAVLMLLLIPSKKDFRVPAVWKNMYTEYRSMDKQMLKEVVKRRKAQKLEEAKETQTAATEETASEEQLQLTELGESGAYLRKKPEKDAKVVAVLKGKVVMQKLKDGREDKTDWFLVKLEDGRKGWIHASLVKVLEE